MAWYYDDFVRPPTVAERAAQAAEVAARLRAEGRELKPVQITGTKIAQTFWGKAWCEHIETYSDYASRLPRGRSYARNGSVIDVQLHEGAVRALVNGSELYEVEIDVQPLAPQRWKAIVQQCSGQIDSVIALLTGELSDAVMTLLCDREKGLFPGARELKLSCSCPDRAGLCKHLAAVLYGIGARLDKEPELFFLLRGVDQLDLVSQAGGAPGDGEAELKADDLAELFGIELASEKGGHAPFRVKRRKRPKLRRGGKK